MSDSDRRFVTTHPWLTFDVRRELGQAPALLWQLVGGIVALTEHLGRTPVMPSYARELYKVYLAKGALATTAIEGNTLTEDDVRQILDGRLRLPPSKEYLADEVENMVGAFDRIMRNVATGSPIPLTTEVIKEWNREILKDLPLDEDVVPGEISEKGVVVGNYRGAPREDCEYLLDRLCGWLDNGLPVDGSSRMSTAVIRANLAHLYLAWIHPFGDGNGRTARLVEFQILANAGVPAPAAHLLSNHFNETRSGYYRQLSHASRSGGETAPFLIYAFQGFYDGLRGQLDKIQRQTEELIWTQIVDASFDSDSPANQRRRRLANFLFRDGGTVAKSRLRQLDPVLEFAYASKTTKTLTRDLGVLLDLELIVHDARGYRANRELVMGLFPLMASEAGSETHES